MALNDLQQIRTLIDQSHYILVVFAPSHTGDSLATALAWKYFLEHSHKQVEIASENFSLPKNLGFLKGSDVVKPTLSRLQKFIIKVDVSKTEIENLSYDIKDQTLSIYLTPKHGFVTKNDLRTAQSIFKYDLIITINTPDLESLGELFQNNTDLFYRTPLINIDYRPHNEQYGQLNLVDVTATASAEVTYGLLRQLNNDLIDADTATALLTGMIATTKSFKTTNVTPQALALASELIKRGGERERIINQLYQTKSLTTLKLWGQALSHLQSEPSLGLVWTTLTREDFIRSGAEPDDLHGVIDELISNSPEAKIILLLYEINTPGEQGKIHGLISTEKNFSAIDMVRSFNPTGDRKQARFTVEEKQLHTVEAAVIERIREHRSTKA